MDLLGVVMEERVDAERAESNLISTHFNLSNWVLVVPYTEMRKQGRKD